jgi:hypothetical protein
MNFQIENVETFLPSGNPKEEILPIRIRNFSVKKFPWENAAENPKKFLLDTYLEVSSSPSGGRNC